MVKKIAYTLLYVGGNSVDILKEIYVAVDTETSHTYFISLLQ